MFMNNETNTDPLIQEIENELKVVGMSKTHFCDHISTSTQNYNNWRTRGVPANQLSKISRKMGWDLVALSNGRVIRKDENTRTPFSFGVEEENSPYNSHLTFSLDLLTFVMRFIRENYSKTYDKESPEEQAETIYALCDLFTDEAAKKMKPASIIKLIRKAA